MSWTPVHGGVAAINAVLEGKVDVSYGGLGPVIKSRAEGNPVRCGVDGPWVGTEPDCPEPY